jgi:tetrahydromethanopterin S-methyltransferase subunit A
MEDIEKLAEQAEKLAEIEKCRTCQCFHDMLFAFKELVRKEKVGQELETRLEEITRKSGLTHNCLGCDPCYPVPISNALYEMSGGSVAPSGSVCKPAPMQIMRMTPSWPIEQGEYIIGRKASPVAISTLGSDQLPDSLAANLGKERFAIIGKTHTENIGIEKVIKNTVTNPDIRFIILCGKDTRGHMAGQSFNSLQAHGVNAERRITNSAGKRPVLKNLDFLEIEHFRSQVEVIDLINTEDISLIEEKVDACIENNPGRFDKTLKLRKVDRIEALQPRRLILDPSGYFIIYPKKDEGMIYLEHYKADGALNEIIFGRNPVWIASAAIDRNLISKLDHAAYLGRELAKAEFAIRTGATYTQDAALGEGLQDKKCSDSTCSCNFDIFEDQIPKS